jgi:hypothetical protein
METPEEITNQLDALDEADAKSCLSRPCGAYIGVECNWCFFLSAVVL